ncbi:MAG: head-tail adaptor protein [Sphingomonas sp.]|nr:head-tail adaptor protein [Sphingomonas sp.]
MSAREFAGLLRERVIIEALTGERNVLGAELPDYRIVARCLAMVAPEGVGAEAEGQALSAMARFRVTVRVREGIAVGQRVRWRERLLIIRQRIDDPALPDRITLRCEEIRS